MQEKRAELDRSRQALEDAQTEGNLEKAAELQYGKIPQLEKNYKNLKMLSKTNKAIASA